MSGNIMQLPVLVLNANFAPLNVCHLRRALGLVMEGRAELVANGRGYVSTARQQIACPSIIRLEKMIRRPRPTVKFSRWEIFRRDNNTCQYCGRRSGNLTLDHVLPRHRGGAHTWENVVAACPPCNRLKGGRTPREAHMNLRRVANEPHPSAMYLYGRYLEEFEDWRPFLEGW